MITMMKSKVRMIDDLGNDPEVKEIGTGQWMLHFSLAPNERCRAADGTWEDDTQWHPWWLAPNRPSA